LSFFLHFPLLIFLFLTFFNFTSLSFHYCSLLSSTTLLSPQLASQQSLASTTMPSKHFLITLFFFLLISCNTLSASTSSEKQDTFDFVRPIDRKLLGLNKKEKLSHFKFYWHDIVSGKNPTSIVVIPPSLNSTTAFGLVNMIDNPLTLGPQLNSKLVGKAQGFYASASQEDLDFLMAMNFAFIEGKYNGSTITILGRNAVFIKLERCLLLVVVDFSDLQEGMLKLILIRLISNLGMLVLSTMFMFFTIDC